MALVMGRDDGVAPVWRRVAAGVVDFALEVGGGTVATGAPVVWIWVRGTDEDIAEVARRHMAAPFGEGELGRRRSEQIDVGLRFARLLTRSRISPGQQLLGIRWADAATGGEAPLARMAARELLSYGLRRTLDRVNRPRFERYQERSAETERRIQELQETLGDDPDAFGQATAGVHKETGPSCLGVMASSCAVVLIEPLTVFLSPRRQSLIDRAAGVVVVRGAG